eukprot:366448-Chlamydomonas_euryale.AAC.7
MVRQWLSPGAGQQPDGPVLQDIRVMFDTFLAASTSAACTVGGCTAACVAGGCSAACAAGGSRGGGGCSAACVAGGGRGGRGCSAACAAGGGRGGRGCSAAYAAGAAAALHAPAGCPGGGGISDATTVTVCP